MKEKVQAFLKKINEYVNRFYKTSKFEKWELLLLIMIGGFSFLFWEHMQLKKEFAETKKIADVLQKKSGINIYEYEDLRLRQVGDLYVQIPEEWNNIIPDYISVNGVRRHFIASFGNGFGIPFANEYAFMVGIEKRGVSGSLEDFLYQNELASDAAGDSEDGFTKVNEEMYYIPREDVGREYFRKIDDVVIVVFVYDNGDREVDDFEQKFVNSVGLVERDTLFDYK